MKETKIVSDNTKNAIRTYLDQNEKFKNSYFCSNFGNASDKLRKRSQELFNYSGDGIELSFSIALSKNKGYVTKEIFIDGKKKTAASLKKFIK